MTVRRTGSHNGRYCSKFLNSSGSSRRGAKNGFIFGASRRTVESSDVSSSRTNQNGLSPTLSGHACTYKSKSRFRLCWHVSTGLAVFIPIVFHVLPAASPEGFVSKAWQPTAAYATIRRAALNTTPTTGSTARSLALQNRTGIVIGTAALPIRKPTGIIANIQSYMLPAQGEFTSGYGYRWGRLHRGIDIAGPIGTPIVAASAGKVITAGWGGGFGYKVEIRHPDGTVTLYAHASKLLTKVGAHVRQGEVIAEMGNSGNSTGSHLHFQIHPRGKDPVNPSFFFSETLKLACASNVALAAAKTNLPKLTKGEGCYSNKG